MKTSSQVLSLRPENTLQNCFGGGWGRGSSRHPFNLSMTTSHPESADEWAGEVVRVPAEFAEQTVIIDLNEVTRIDSWGIALFIEAMHRISAHGGNLVLIRIREDVRRLLETASGQNWALDCLNALAIRNLGLCTLPASSGQNCIPPGSAIQRVVRGRRNRRYGGLLAVACKM